MSFARFFRRSRHDTDRAAELACYIDEETARNIDRGMSPQESRDAARRKLGNPTSIREQIYYFNTVAPLENLWRDCKSALRGFRRQPTFTAAVILTLALGIGANTAVFSVVDAVVLRPLPVRDAGGIIAIDTLASHLTQFGNSSYLDYVDLCARAKSFESLNIFQSFVVGLNAQPSKADSKAEATYGLLVSANLFSSLGVTPLLGRSFRPEEGNVPDKYPVAMISYGLWQRSFSGSKDILGRQVTLSGQPFTIVGVTPKSFAGPDLFARPDLYVATGMARAVGEAGLGVLTNRTWRGFRMKGRLRRGVSVAQAQAELNVIVHELEREHPDTNKDNVMIVRNDMARRWLQNSSVPLILSILVVLVLLITCANVANLLLARASSRLREIATQLSIGAGRTRLLAQIMTESALLAAGGAIAGIALAYAGVKGIAALLPWSVLSEGPELRLDRRVLLCTAVLSCATLLLYGLVPALASIRQGWHAAIGTRTATSAGGLAGGISRRFLIGAQVALCTLLLVVGALFLKAFEKARGTDLGFDPNHLLVATFDPSLNGYSAEQVTLFYRNLLREAAGIPGVQASSLAAGIPFMNGQTWDLSIDGYTAPTGERWLDIGTNRAAPAYFATMKIPLLTGREFSEKDSKGAPLVAIVNEKFARQYLVSKGDLSGALGRVIHLRDPGAIQIVGVVADSKSWNLAESFPLFYLSAFQFLPNAMTLHLRYDTDPANVIAVLRKKIARIDGQIAPLEVTQMSRSVAEHALFMPRMLTVLSASFALIALLLAVVGLYGVMAFMVSRRTQEIGIRMAVGAQQSAVLWMVMKNGLGVVLVGLLVGGAGALLVAPTLQNLLAGVNPRDPEIFLSIVCLLLVAGGLATWIPASRAAKVEPLEALRYE